MAREICVFEYDTVRLNTPNVVFPATKKLFKYMGLKFTWWTENPRVGSSILPLATIEINNLHAVFKNPKKSALSALSQLRGQL